MTIRCNECRRRIGQVGISAKFGINKVRSEYRCGECKIVKVIIENKEVK